MDYPFLRLLNLPSGDDGHVNMIIDKSLSLGETREFCRAAGAYVGHWKMGFGTAALWDSEALKEKIRIIREHRILVYPGGTLFEAHAARDRAGDYFQHLREFGFNAIEISDGSLEIPRKERERYIQDAKQAGLTVVAEVGKKDPRNQLSADQAAEQLQLDFACGADYVVLEARESGLNVGIYNERGEVKEDYFNRILKGIPVTYEKRVVWEAPLKAQQVFLIEHLSAAVSLGNLRPDEVLAVEALRRGLRWETFNGT